MSRVVCVCAQDHFNLRTSAQQLKSRKKLLDAAGLLDEPHVRACVPVVLGRRLPGPSPGPARAIRALPLDNRTPRQRSFTDVRTRHVIGMARSYPKSEYAQPLVDPKQTYFIVFFVF